MPEQRYFTGYNRHDNKKYTARDVLWEKFRTAWQKNEDFRNSYGASGFQPLPVRSIEAYEDVLLIDSTNNK